MQIEMLANGSLKILLSPENEMEEAFIAMLCKQDNDITEVRQQIFVLNKRFDKGILIGKRASGGSEVITPSED